MSETVAIVCGSRHWPTEHLWIVTAKMIELLPHGCTVRHGAAPGIDTFAGQEAIRLHWPVDPMPADWERYGKRAGILRNVAMLDKQPHPSVVLAFHWDYSRGTAHLIREALRRRIPTHVVTERDLVPDAEMLALFDSTP